MITQNSKKSLATWEDDVLLVGIPRVSFEDLSVITITYRFSFKVRSNIPRMSIETNLRGPLVKNNGHCLF